jgi:hypothetical protein
MFYCSVPRCSNSSALFLTTANIFPPCCPLRRKMFHVVAYNANHFSALLLTTQKRALISVHVCCSVVVANNADYFSALWTTALKTCLRCCLQHGKMVSVVGSNAEKCSNSIISTNLKPYANSH